MCCRKQDADGPFRALYDGCVGFARIGAGRRYRDDPGFQRGPGLIEGLRGGEAGFGVSTRLPGEDGGGRRGGGGGGGFIAIVSFPARSRSIRQRSQPSSWVKQNMHFPSWEGGKPRYFTTLQPICFKAPFVKKLKPHKAHFVQSACSKAQKMQTIQGCFPVLPTSKLQKGRIIV